MVLHQVGLVDDLPKAEKSIGDKEPVGLPWPTPAGEMVGVLINGGGGSVLPMVKSGPKPNHSLKSKYG